jgi:SNF2 family DNA or RNA helicase
MYFDLYRDKIICNLKFLYDGEEIDYFDTNSTILRDSEYEENVLNDLYACHFSINKNKILLENTEDIGEFLENYLIKLTEKYETYTSSRLKEIKVVKDNKIRSTFSIGQDNIMSYSFDLGDIKSDEIVNILEAFKDKKKYYRLKTGDLIDINNNKDLEELDKLVTDMNIGKKELETGKGTIPKYRAIYLDSIKNNNYHIIETDNLFNELIEKFNKYKDCDVNLSAKDKKIAREYQIEGIKWLYTIDKTGFGGILADEMGLGKSIQTIFYIKELLKENKDYKFLIVAPTSLAYNWENEFMKFAPELKYGIMAGKRSGRREKLEHSDNLNVIITTYGLLREDKEIYDKMHFKTFIIDEAQNIRNVNTNITKTVKDVNADTKIALTGTPIENSVLELWSIFDFIMPGFLTNLETFSHKYKIKDFDEDSEEKIKNLQKLISPFILRRRKKDVIKDLPEKIENNIYVELTKEQKKLYVAELEKVQSEMEEILATEGISKARFLILKLLTKLRQICIDPRIVFDNYDGASGKTEEFLNVVKTMTQEGHKILVFTSFRTALELVRKELNKNKITSYTIDGSVSSKKRMELVDKFNNDDTNVFLIMLKAGGTGLNLTSADIVIHLDLWWNPQAENQATDRAHRIGQKNKVQVIKLITKGTIEEKILELQQKKKILSEKLIDENDVNQALDKLTEKDIKELLSFDNDED